MAKIAIIAIEIAIADKSKYTYENIQSLMLIWGKYAIVHCKLASEMRTPNLCSTANNTKEFII